MDDHKQGGLATRLPTEVPRCPINVAARRSGLSAHVIRAWERRYSAITPERTSKSRRLYSDWEVRRLVLLRQAVELGHRIGEIARLPMEELRALVGRDTLPGVEASPRIPLPRARLVEVTLDAARALDGAGFAQALLQATRTLSVPELFDEFVGVLAAEIAAQVRSGKLRLAHQRFAAAYLRSYLGDLLASCGAAPWSSSVVVSTAPGELQELGAMMAAVTASRAGWDVIYVGPSMPIDELAFIAQQRNANAVLLSSASDAAACEPALAKLRGAIGAEPTIFHIGAALPSAQPPAGLMQPASLLEFSQQLEAIRRS
ncbi:MAG: MerR family regulatory protein [Hydrocarboniphaga sp.]|uniref:MerR family transcriptional regulator n=1 Tax=Hydrocarboniphaga sp. TaxID=2033016 RepID=UPI00262DF900|nr:MerR family transcriptional regulator [Hydrocarboniphaga sp.]MDB5970885.1 MerR family regulatory protein [Hydrocarboniphaga sp.]